MNDAYRAMQLFEQALELQPAARADFLDAECADNRALRDEIEALLRADAASTDFLAQPLAGTADRSGERLGSYRLLQLVGSGGMGSVYRAERADGAYSKPVAIKLLLYDAGDLRTRFALEQRILGALSHVHIASLLDVGNDQNGAPYLVMEYVEGAPITVYARQHALDVRTRLQLFLKILDAVQTAHGQLVVHRDIKPSNVLVDRHGEPKLLDFGIAKLVGDSAPSTTRTGLGPLTPEYASPEQVRGEPLGTASDIYSLGVLLFELVTGERPYRITDTRPSAIERVVCETAPPRPSTQMQTRQLGGSTRDLDAVILKALAKQPARRYASCATFAEDLRRWLDGEEVLARQPPWTERTARILRRYKLAVSVAAAATLALLVGSTFALWQAHEASIARDRAERINVFLQDMLGATDHGNLGRNAKLGDILDSARRNADHVLANDPPTRIATELTLAKTYVTLGDLDSARETAQSALTLAEQNNLEEAALETRIVLGYILAHRGDFAAAETLLVSARAEALKIGTPRQRGDSAAQLGFLETRRDNAAAAQRWLETALDETPSELIESRAAAMNDLAVVQDSREDYAGALITIRQGVALLRDAFPLGHPLLAQSLGNLATVLDDSGDHAAASAQYDEALKMKIELFGENHFSVVSTLSTLTWRSVQQKDTAAALGYGARAWAAAQTLSSDNPQISYAAITYAQALMQANRPREALPLAETALKMRRAKLPPEDIYLINTESVLGLVQAQAGDVAAGEALARSAYQRQLAKLGEKHVLTVAAKQRLEQVVGLKTPVPQT